MTNIRLRRAVAALCFVIGSSIWLSSCAMEANVPKISQVVYTAESGAILPERQWHERFTITGDRITLMRTGRVSATEVNTGTWKFPADAQAVAALFDQLGAVDCSSLKRIEPADPPDGGGTESFEIIYADGAKCLLTVDPGVTYTGGAPIVASIRAFVYALTLPAGAAPLLP